jgi:hypothetical protein
MAVATVESVLLLYFLIEPGIVAVRRRTALGITYNLHGLAMGSLIKTMKNPFIGENMERVRFPIFAVYASSWTAV